MWTILRWLLGHHFLSNLHSTAIFPHASVNFSWQIGVIFNKEPQAVNLLPQKSQVKQNQRSPRKERGSILLQGNALLPHNCPPNTIPGPRPSLSFFNLHPSLCISPYLLGLLHAFIQAAPKNTCLHDHRASQIAKVCSLIPVTPPNS